MYTTLMGVAAGTALIVLVLLGVELHKGKVTTFGGWALGLAVPGLLLTVTGLHMTLTQSIKLEGEVFKNSIFGELSAAFGVLALAAAFYLWRRGEPLLARPDLVDHLYVIARPVSIMVFGLGLGLLACTIGAFDYQIFATAPQAEPIMGTWPKWLVNTGLSSLLALPAVGALLAPVAIWRANRRLLGIAGVAFFAAGVGWVLTGALVYYTHIAMDFNLRAG
ncbi:DUF981 domain-containing protein [Actinomadura viridis]|uniref:DUF981 family protein n=1 Tax=Actinomadura viridis TaxID=58110 RepID=A0A931DHB5_9ACTN|nr:DUF981 family protein [Actinomadura viridis]MBG6087556.1 hypothetical protein [Actinomadura viridis]